MTLNLFVSGFCLFAGLSASIGFLSAMCCGLALINFGVWLGKLSNDGKSE